MVWERGGGGVVAVMWERGGGGVVAVVWERGGGGCYIYITHHFLDFGLSPPQPPLSQD